MRARERRVGAADHEGERRRLCAPVTPPDTGASTMSSPLLLRRRGDRARGVDVDGRAVDQQRAARRRGQHTAGAEIDVAHMLAGRQHGDDDVGAAARLGYRWRRGAAARRRIAASAAASRSKPRDRVPGLEQVLRHRQAHIAEPDECDRRHG